MIVPSASGLQMIIELTTGRRAPLTKLAAGGYQERHARAPMTEAEVGLAVETIADGGGVVGVLPGRIDVEIADNSTQNVTLGAVAAITAAFIDYHCTRAGSTQWGMIEIVILDDGSTVEYVSDPRWQSGEAGVGLAIAGDISGGNLRLNLTTDASGGAADFRATYRTIEP